MATVEKTIEVNKPVRTVYNQWTQFEEFPRFMEGVESVTQIDDSHLRWKASIGGAHREWDAEIVHQEPDRRIAWRSLSGAANAGDVTFQPAGAGATAITLRLDFEPDGPVEKAGQALGVVSKRVEGDLERFRDFIEGRVAETGAWRGQVP
ncbi:MAG: SRPBCC family protein [Actinomycetota bacterium]|jgi:uncharacterized membrane protein